MLRTGSKIIASFDRLDDYLQELQTEHNKTEVREKKMSKKESSVASEPEERVLSITRIFDAPVELVFDAWLDSKTVGRWLFATPDGKMDSVKIDPRVGGEFEIIDKRGDELTRHIGTYLKIDRPRQLIFTFAVPQYSEEFTKVTVDIVPLDSGCELTLTHEGVLPEWHEKTSEGWTMILNGLAANLPQA